MTKKEIPSIIVEVSDGVIIGLEISEPMQVAVVDWDYIKEGKGKGKHCGYPTFERQAGSRSEIARVWRRVLAEARRILE